MIGKNKTLVQYEHVFHLLREIETVRYWEKLQIPL